MYKLLIILRYLRRKLVPMFAAAAVTLCTAMVIIVISIMGGFLEMMCDTARRLTSDVTVRGDLTGFPDYGTMLRQIGALPEVEAATPIIATYGLLKLQGRVLTVEVQGIRPREFDRVTAGLR